MSSKITVNGRTIEIPDGANVSVMNNQVLVNGEPYDGGEVKDERVVIEGNVGSVTTDKPVEVKGDVRGDVDAGGSVTCDAVEGSVDANGSVTCDAVGGSVQAGGSVTCEGVGGNIQAGGSVTSL